VKELSSYGVSSDSKNNFYGMNLNGTYIIKVDAKTKTVTPYADADAERGTAPRPHGCPGPPLVRRIPRQQDRHVRHEDAEVPGVGGADAVDERLRRHCGQRAGTRGAAA
jgi:hypothetical protein